MGSRANLILVRDGRYDLRYSHWAAATLSRDLFWGPEHAVAFVEAQRMIGTEWLDDIWADGGAIVDLDRRIFRLFAEDLCFDVPLRRLYLSLLAMVWQGWDVGWADEGIAELADYVGYPRKHVLSSKENYIKTPGLEPPAEPDWVDIIGSARLGDGSLRLFPLAGCGVVDFLMYGLPLEEVAAAQPGLERLSLAGWTSGFPIGGFHLELSSKSLIYWTAEEQPGVQTRVEVRWPGWSVTWLRDRYEDQLAACGGALSFPIRPTRKLFDQLRLYLLDPPGVSMAERLLEISEITRPEGSVSEINPLALRNDRVELFDEAKAEILRGAAAELGLA